MRTIVYYLLLVAVAFSVLPGCGDDYDDTALREELSEQAERIAALEAWQSSVNTNISSLQGLVAALEAKDYVTGVVPVVEGGTTVGYTIRFTKSSPITIYHGSTGSTGSAPEIGVAQYTDGRYYWTLNGEWIIDADGAMIPTTGNDGQNGQDGSDGKDGADGWDGQTGTTGKTPKVIIGTDGYWYISPDGTATGTPPDGTGWQSTNVKATGDKGEQGDAIFDKDGVNNDNEDYVEFTLADGNTITLPKYKTIGISFTAPEAFTAGENKEIPYTSTGTVSPTNIRVINLPTGWTASVDTTENKISITAPEAAITTGKAEGTALVLISDQSNQVMGMYDLELSRKHGVSDNTVGAEYYENGKLKGYVYKVNNGSADSGLIIHLVEVGAFTYTGADNVPQSINLMYNITGEKILEKIQTLNN